MAGNVNQPQGNPQPPPAPMAAIRAARYAPLVLPNNLHDLPGNNYLKVIPKFDNEGDSTAEKHLAKFYTFADDFQVDEEDVWLRLFAHSLEGEVRKWFRKLPPNSIAHIIDFDAVFLRKWGDKKDDLYYMTEFNSLSRKNGESVSDFSVRFNKMYHKIPDDIRPLERLAKLTYANAFSHDFCLLLRERKATTLQDMQDAAIEVESNLLASEQLKKRFEKGK